MAGRPTFVAARGSAEQGGYRRHNPSMAYSSRDLASHTKMKTRQPGQNTSDEVSKRDLKRELDDKEKKVKKDDKKKDEDEEKTLAIKEKGESDDEMDRRSRGKEKAKDKNFNIDADDSDDSDSSSDEENGKKGKGKGKGKGKQAAKKNGKRGGDDGSESESDDESDDDSEDETDELMRELERIKKEREQERMKQESIKSEENAKRQSETMIHGNPLLHQDYSIKRKWYDDVVFKNQARDEPEQKKRFVNDTTRNDFARKFLAKYIK